MNIPGLSSVLTSQVFLIKWVTNYKGMMMRYIYYNDNEILSFTKKFTLYNIIIVGLMYCILWSETLILGFQKIVLLLLNKGILAYLYFFLKIYILGVIAIIFGILIHELIHAFFFTLLSRNNFKSIKFGFKRKPLLFYVHCTDSLNIYAFRTGVIMPGLIIGLIPTIVGLICGNIYMTVYGIIFTSGAAGDLMVLIATKGLSGSQKIRDLPDKMGFEVVG